MGYVPNQLDLVEIHVPLQLYQIHYRPSTTNDEHPDKVHFLKAEQAGVLSIQWLQ